MSSRKVLTTTKGTEIFYGMDKVNGMFIQFMNAPGDVAINFSEFYPFHTRLTYELIEKAIKEKVITRADFKELCKQEIGDFKVYFSGIGILEDIEGFEYPERLLKHYHSGRGFKVKTVGDYIRLLKLFKKPVVFTKVDWYLNLPKSSVQLYSFVNDESVD